MKTSNIVRGNAMYAPMRWILAEIKPYGYIMGFSTILCISAGHSRNGGFVGYSERGHQEGDIGYTRDIASN